MTIKRKKERREREETIKRQESKWREREETITQKPERRGRKLTVKR